MSNDKIIQPVLRVCKNVSENLDLKLVSTDLIEVFIKLIS